MDTSIPKSAEELKTIMEEALHEKYPDYSIRVGNLYIDNENREIICIRSMTDKAELPVMGFESELREQLKEHSPLEVYESERENTNFEKALLDIEWVLDNMTLEVTSSLYKDVYEIREGTIKRAVEGTDLYLIPSIDLRDEKAGKIYPYRFSEKYLGLFAGIVTEDEIYETGEKNLEVKVTPGNKGFIHVAPAAKIFCKGFLDELLGEDVGRGIYVLPYQKEESSLLWNEHMTEKEIKDMYVKSRAGLIGMNVLMGMDILTENNRLSKNMYFYKDGKFRIV